MWAALKIIAEFGFLIGILADMRENVRDGRAYCYPLIIPLPWPVRTLRRQQRPIAFWTHILCQASFAGLLAVDLVRRSLSLL
jgi:hypothetical protein